MMRSKLSENAFEQINCWVKNVHETLEKVSDFGMNILTPPKWMPGRYLHIKGMVLLLTHGLLLHLPGFCFPNIELAEVTSKKGHLG